MGWYSPHGSYICDGKITIKELYFSESITNQDSYLFIHDDISTKAHDLNQSTCYNVFFNSSR